MFLLHVSLYHSIRDNLRAPYSKPPAVLHLLSVANTVVASWNIKMEYFQIIGNTYMRYSYLIYRLWNRFLYVFRNMAQKTEHYQTGPLTVLFRMAKQKICH